MTAETRLAQLLAAHGIELARHLRRMVHDDEIAQDLLQDTMLRAYKALPRLGSGANERAWLYRIATNAALNHLRGRARERKAMERHARETDHAVPARAAVEADDARAVLWQRVASLPERQRLALTYRIVDELEYADIAVRMACTEQAARANVYQATKKLKMGGVR